MSRNRIELYRYGTLNETVSTLQFATLHLSLIGIAGHQFVLGFPHPLSRFLNGGLSYSVINTSSLGG